jgi:hypothetical protein
VLLGREDAGHRDRVRGDDMHDGRAVRRGTKGGNRNPRRGEKMSKRYKYFLIFNFVSQIRDKKFGMRSTRRPGP